MSVVEGTLERAWVWSPEESLCHAIPHAACSGPMLTPDCDRPLYGPVHHRRGWHPPEEWRYAVCEPCLVAIDYVPPRAVPWRPIAWVAQDWPDTDPDESMFDESPTGRTAVLNEALDHDTNEPDPGSTTLPGSDHQQPSASHSTAA